MNRGAYHLLRIERIVQETQDAIRIHFFQPKVERLLYKPGQFLTLKIPIEGKSYFRAYSLYTTRRLDRFLGIVVKRKQTGFISHYLLDHLEEGMEMEAIAPSGNFYLLNTVKDARHIVLIGGGSGITPLMAMLRSVLYDAPLSKVSLLYANSTYESIIFRKEIEQLAHMFPNRFHRVHVLSQENNPADRIPFVAGRLNESLLHDLLGQLPFDLSPERYCVCGPTGIMSMAVKVLKDRRVSQEAILQESFTGPTAVANIPKGIETQEVHIELRGQEHHFSVPAGMSILDAGLAQGIDMPHSCRAGTCATCMATLVSGEVKMLDPAAITDWERERGLRLTCQALPLSKDVKVKFP